MTSPRRLLVKLPNWLGDLVLIHPALRALDLELRRSEPATSLSVMVPRGLVGFYRATPWVDAVVPHPWPVSWRLPRHLVAASAVRAHRPDRILLVTGSFESALWAWLARVPERVGASTEGRGVLLTARVEGLRAADSSHYAEHWRRVLSGLAGTDLQCEPTPPDVDGAARREVAAWLSRHRRRPERPLVVLAPASAQHHKCWPTRRWAELADALDSGGLETLVAVAPWERAIAEQVAARTRGPTLISSDLGVAELIALAELADGWIGNDSGPSHVAAALGTPTLAVFLSSDPARSGPCGPLTATVGPAGSREGPATEAVLAAWSELS